jgi:hemolysin activation/secretion protein
MPAAGERIAAFNVEVRRQFRLPIPLIRDLLGNSTLVGFYDRGKIWITEDLSGTLADAGLGLRLRHRKLRQNFLIRVDFPIWLSSPELDENGVEKDNVRFRWILGFSRVF